MRRALRLLGDLLRLLFVAGVLYAVLELVRGAAASEASPAARIGFLAVAATLLALAWPVFRTAWQRRR